MKCKRCNFFKKERCYAFNNFIGLVLTKEETKECSTDCREFKEKKEK